MSAVVVVLSQWLVVVFVVQGLVAVAVCGAVAVAGCGWLWLVGRSWPQCSFQVVGCLVGWLAGCSARVAAFCRGSSLVAVVGSSGCGVRL